MHLTILLFQLNKRVSSVDNNDDDDDDVDYDDDDDDTHVF